MEKGSRRPRGYRRAAYNDINKVALRCFKGYFDFGSVASEYTVKNGGCSSCPIRCYTEYDVDPLADYDLPTHNSNTCMPVLYAPASTRTASTTSSTRATAPWSSTWHGLTPSMTWACGQRTAT